MLLMLLTTGMALTAQTETSSAPPPAIAAQDAPPFTGAQLEYLEQMRTELEAEIEVAKTNPALEIKADAFIKWLYRNNTRQGCVTYGNPHPRGTTSRATTARAPSSD